MCSQYTKCASEAFFQGERGHKEGNLKQKQNKKNDLTCVSDLQKKSQVMQINLPSWQISIAFQIWFM